MNETFSETHTFTYEVKGAPDANPQQVSFKTSSVDQDLTLDDMFESFEKYLIATGYVLPDGMSVGLVENSIVD